MKPRTFAHPKTLAEWRLKIIASLGGVGWNVELTEPTLDHALWQTMALYNKYRPKVEWRPLGEITGDRVFDFSDEDTGVNVKDVKFKRQELGDRTRLGLSYSGHLLPFGLRGARMAHKSAVAQDRHRSLLGVQPDWRWDAEGRKLYVTAFDALMPVLATALVLVPHRLEAIGYALEYDFLEGAVGHAKLIVGRQLVKYGPIPSAQGGISLDGATLKTEGRDAVKEYAKMLDNNIMRVPPRPIFS
jgi:hypothetical protein